MALAKLSNALIKALSGTGKRTKSQNASITKAANAAKMERKEFIKEAKQQIKNKDSEKKDFGTIKDPKPYAIKRSGEKVKHTRSQRAEIKRLAAAQDKERAKERAQSTSIGRRSKTEAPKGSPIEGQTVEGGVNTYLLSKAKLDPKLKNYSKKRLRQLIKQGMAKLVKTKRKNKDGTAIYEVRATGKFAEPSEAVAEKMGLGGTQRALPSEESLRKRGGFQIRKRGGTVRRSSGGAIGIGAALRGYGKGYKK